jgi:hypothetical protein
MKIYEEDAIIGTDQIYFKNYDPFALPSWVLAKNLYFYNSLLFNKYDLS